MRVHCAGGPRFTDLVYVSGLGDAEEELGARDVHLEHLGTVGGPHGLGGTRIDVHRVPDEAVFLLEARVEQIEVAGVLGGALVDGLLEEVTRTLKLGAALCDGRGQAVGREKRAQMNLACGGQVVRAPAMSRLLRESKEYSSA